MEWAAAKGIQVQFAHSTGVARTRVPGDSGSFYPHNSDTFMDLDCAVLPSGLAQKGDAWYICGEPGKVGADRLSQEFQGSMYAGKHWRTFI